MELYIDTSKNEYFKLSLSNNGKIIGNLKIEAKFRQSEKLLLSIDNLLKTANCNINQIKKIVVNDKGEGFSALRIGVVTANALAYALGISCQSPDGQTIKTGEFNLVKPSYSQEPNIG